MAAFATLTAATRTTGAARVTMSRPAVFDAFLGKRPEDRAWQ